MLYMTIYTYEPGKRDEVIKRRAEKGPMIPEGMKLIGEWSAIGAGRIFRLIETEEPKALLTAALPWGDLGKMETMPVMPVEDVFKVLSSR